MNKHRLAGSERGIPMGAKASAAAHPDERLEVSVLVRRRDTEGFSALLRSVTAGEAGARVDRNRFAALYGAAPEDMAAVAAFARDAGLTVVSADAACRTMRLSGTVTQFNRAFDVELQHFEHQNGT